jgi:hypothetical protein
MKIDLTDTGYKNLPALKKILTERDFDSNDIKKIEKIVTVKLFGRYASSAALETGVNGLKTLLETDVEHDFLFTSRAINFDGVANRGFKAVVFRNDVSITMEIVVTEEVIVE